MSNFFQALYDNAPDPFEEMFEVVGEYDYDPETDELIPAATPHRIDNFEATLITDTEYAMVPRTAGQSPPPSAAGCAPFSEWLAANPTDVGPFDQELEDG